MDLSSEDLLGTVYTEGECLLSEGVSMLQHLCAYQDSSWSASFPYELMAGVAHGPYGAGPPPGKPRNQDEVLGMGELKE